VVLAGSFTRPIAARQGDVFDADCGRLGRFSFEFV
jgi:2-oxo-hept-3-ene-1,7-dioate hydratase